MFEFRLRPAEGPRTAVRLCEHEGCLEAGEYRAPKSRENLSEYHWFCLDHVRAYNQAWNYFAGMGDDEVAAFQRAAVTGHRPTWTFGRRSAPSPDAAQRWSMEADDVFTVLQDGPGGPGAANAERPRRRLSRVQEDALAALGLPDEATLNDVKARYKELVKRYHPDANGGDRGAEERLKQVIKAYGVLKSSGLR